MTTDELRTKITRGYGLSDEDADKVINLVAEEAIQRYLDSLPAELTSTHERDQEDAAIFDISKSVARHFRTLRAEGMGEQTAADLCEGFQHQLLGGSDTTLTLVGAGEDEE